MKGQTLLQHIMRNFKIFFNRYQELPLNEFLGILREALFQNVPVLVYQFDLSGWDSRTLLNGVEGIECKKGALPDLEIVRQTLMPLPWEFQCHEFDGVEDFFVAKDGGGIQHISWIYLHGHPNRFLALGKKEAEIKFCLTLPALRGRGIYPRVIQSILEYLRSAGIERVFMCVHTKNAASIRGIEKAGFTRLGEIRLRKIMGIQVSPRYDTNRRVS